MVVALTIEKMIQFYHGNIHDVSHFLKVYAFAKTIGELEGLTPQTQETLELAAVVHDIACPLCREKYGNTNGKNQELESPPLIEIFLPFSRFPRKQYSESHGSWRAITPMACRKTWIIKSCWKLIILSMQEKAAFRQSQCGLLCKRYSKRKPEVNCYLRYICNSRSYSVP